MKIYTRRGDDGTTGLWSGGRVRKDDGVIELLGCVDEAQAALGLARAQVRGQDLDETIAGLQRDLWILMAEVATAPEHRGKLEPGKSSVTSEMVGALEGAIDALSADLDLAPAFSVPGETPLSAALDFARTVVRRAERASVSGGPADSLVAVYLNRLSDLCFVLARSVEGGQRLNRRSR